MQSLNLKNYLKKKRTIKVKKGYFTVILGSIRKIIARLDVVGFRGDFSKGVNQMGAVLVNWLHGFAYIENSILTSIN